MLSPIIRVNVALLYGLFLYLPSSSYAQVYEVDFVKNPVTALSRASATSILNEVNTIFSEAGNNNSCRGLSFRLGAIRNSAIPASIDSDDQINNLLSRRDNSIVIAEFMNYCANYNPATAGCAGRNTTIIVENQGSSSTREIRRFANIIAHEFGHSQHLMHGITPGTAHSSSRNSLMSPTVSLNNRNITDEECQLLSSNANIAYSTSPSSVESAQLSLDNNGDDQSPPPGSNSDNLINLLAGGWAEGVPFNELEEFSDELSNIRAILLDDAYLDIWYNTVTAIGAIGEEKDIDFLIWFYESTIDDVEPDDRAALKSLTRVPFAIALLAGRHQSNRGVNFLSSQLEVEAVLENFSSRSDLLEVYAGEIGKSSYLGLRMSPGEDSTSMNFGREGSVSAIDAASAVQNFGSEFVQQSNEIGRQVEDRGVESVFSSDAIP